MHPIAQRIRAIAIVAVLWGAAWSLVGIAIGLISWFGLSGAATARFSIVGWLLGPTVRFAVVGAFCGAAFAIVLSRAERNHTVDDLGRGRTALWGVIAGVLCCVAYIARQGALLDWLAHTGPAIEGLVVFGALGGASSVASLAIARRASLPASVHRREISAT